MGVYLLKWFMTKDHSRKKVPYPKQGGGIQFNGGIFSTFGHKSERLLILYIYVIAGVEHGEACSPLLEMQVSVMVVDKLQFHSLYLTFHHYLLILSIWTDTHTPNIIIHLMPRQRKKIGIQR